MPRYSDNTINAIKARLRMSELVQSYIPVVNRGGRLWAKCPFHGGGNEKTPSFAINDNDGFYHCFGCGESGDMFTFVMKMDKVTFPEAVEALASRAGVELETDRNPEARKAAGESEVLFDLNQRIQRTFHYMLVSADEGKAAREYLERRKVSAEMIERFQLGYAPKGSDWLYSFLSGKGFSDDILRKSGLFSQNHYPYSLFQDRLVFPVRNRSGKTIGFSGRDLSGRENVPKYVNSPDTPVYSKKHNFFGIYEALESIKKGSIPVLVEGNFDVVAMHQAGIDSAIASLGTAFTEEQAALIARYAERVDIMFDSDEAGQKSTDKAIMILHARGIDSQVHRLSSGKDASEIIEKYGGKALADVDLHARGGRHEHHVETALFALARDGEAREEHHLNEGERENEARHDVPARDVVFVEAEALDELHGRGVAVLRVHALDDHGNVARRDVRGGRVARVRDDEKASGLGKVVGEVECREHLAPFDGVAQRVEVEARAHEFEDAVFAHLADHFVRKGASAFVAVGPGNVLEIEGGAVAEKHRLREDRDDQDLARTRVAEHRDEFLPDERGDAHERSENVMHGVLLRAIS